MLQLKRIDLNPSDTLNKKLIKEVYNPIISNLIQMFTDSREQHVTLNKKGFVFAAFALGYEVLACVLYGLYFSLHEDLTQKYQISELYVVSALSILTVVGTQILEIGFGLMNSYITSSGVSGFALTLLTFALTIQHFFLMRALWDKAGIHNVNSKEFNDLNYPKISWVNTGQDRGETSELTHASIVDAIACALSMVISLASVIGRVQLLEVFFLSAIGSLVYEINSQLLWNLSINDIGYGIRIFLFGGVMGLVSSLLLGRKKTTMRHPRYRSNYESRAEGILGLVIVFCAFPLLVTCGVYQTSVNFQYIAFLVPFNMWFALGASVLGSLSATALTFRRFHTYDLIYTGLTGGIAYSSCSILNRNPAIPLSVGFIVGFAAALSHGKLFRIVNNSGVVMSLGVLNSYIFPGAMSGVVSFIVYIADSQSFSNYMVTMPPGRQVGRQASFQLAGIGISPAIAAVTGVVIGIIFKICNSHSPDEQFSDDAIFSSSKEKFEKQQDKSK